MRQGKELLKRGTFDLPLELFYVDKKHPRYEMSYHWHDEVEIIYVVSGIFELSIDGTITLAQEGDLFWIAPNQIHGGIPHNCIYECLVFQTFIFKENLDISYFFKAYSITMKNEPISLLYQKLRNELYSQSGFYKITSLGLLYQLIGETMKHNQEIMIKKADEVNKDILIKSIFAYIYDHYQEKITLASLAKIVNLSPKYFCTYFIKITGQTPIEYVNYYRIEKSIEYLVNYQLSITETAFMCGFNEVGYFIRTFKKYRHITPKQYFAFLDKTKKQPFLGDC